MMRSKHLLALLLPGLTAAVVGLTCAPMDAPPTAPSDSTEKEKPVVENLFNSPAPKVVGPQERLELAIDLVRRRELVVTSGFWTVFHGILGLGPSVTLYDPKTGVRVKAVDHISLGGGLRGLEFVETKYGLDVQTQSDFFSQGHQDQYIAEMAQWGMPIDRKFVVYGKEYTFRDFVNHCKMRARVTQDQELSWAIIILAQYFGTDLEWTNMYGEKLRFEDVVRYELDQSINQAACGGTHRLFGLNWALHLHLQKGGKLTGVWEEIDRKAREHAKLARKLQNPNGSFSTNFFRGPGNASERSLRISTTGHTLEWLALALPDEELKQPWMQEAANALALMFLELQSAPEEGGSLYHAAHGLLMYYARVYGGEKLGENNPYIPLPPREKTAAKP